MKVTIYTHDPMLTLVRSEQETVELFGQEVFDEDGIEIPDELAQEMIAAYERIKVLSGMVREKRREHEIETSKGLCRKCDSWQLGVRNKICKKCAQPDQEAT